MLLARSIARDACLKSLRKAVVFNLPVLRSSHTININLSIGKDVRIENVDTGNIIVKQFDSAGHIDKAKCTAASANSSFDNSLFILKNAQLQRLLTEHYDLCELACFVKQHNFTGVNLGYGVQNSADLETLGINRIQAQTFYQLIQVWKAQGVPQVNDNVVHVDRLPQDSVVAVGVSTHSLGDAPVATSHDVDVDSNHHWNEYLSSHTSSTPVQDPPQSVPSPAEEIPTEPEPDAELMEWYAQLDIAFIQARWGGQAQPAQLIQQAAETGQDHLAEAYWSVLLEKGCHQVSVDSQKALYYARRALPWLLTAASAGNPYAQYHLGFCYTDGRGVPYDAEKAVILYELAAAQGHEGARVNLGIAYERGEGVERDLSMAVACYKGAYSHPHALNSYAHCLAHGIGVEAVPELALFYYKQAADLGHIEAQYVVAKCYLEGKVTERDMKEANKYLKLATAQGHQEAINILGVFGVIE